MPASGLSLGIPAFVVADENTRLALQAVGGDWATLPVVGSVAEMWAGLQSEPPTLDRSAQLLIFGDGLAGQADNDLEVALAVMAPHAAVALVAWQPAQVPDLLARVQQTAQTTEGCDPSQTTVHVIKTGSLEELKNDLFALLDAIRGGAPVETAPAYPAAPVEAAPVEAAPAAPIAPIGPAYQSPPPPPPLQRAPLGLGFDPNMAPELNGGLNTDPYGADSQAGPLQHTICVTSGKGGAGKSTTAVLLATTIAQLSGGKHRVCLVDLDLTDGQLPAFIGTHLPTALNLRAESVINEETVAKHLVENRDLGVHALLAPLRPKMADAVGPEFYKQVIRVLQRMFSVVILDTSVRYLDKLATEVSFPESNAIVFVTTPASSAVQSMARALREMLSEPPEGMGIDRGRVGVVVNQSMADVAMTPDLVNKAALGAPIIGAIPLATKDVVYALNTRQMHRLVRHRDLGPAYYKLASNILRDNSLTPPDAGSAPSAGVSNGQAPNGQASNGQANGAVMTAPAPHKKSMFGRNRR